MPRYFFDLSDHVRINDEEGVELSGPAEARVQAIIFAGDYLSDNPELLNDGQRFCVIVRSEQDDLRFRVVMRVEEDGAA